MMSWKSSLAMFVSALAAVAAPVARGGPPEPSVLVEEAFRVFAERAVLAESGEVLAAEVPCGEEVCLRLSIEAVVRETAVKNLPQLVSGFGFAADVRSIELRTWPNAFRMASLVLLVRPGGRVSDVGELAGRVERVARLLRLLARMSEPVREEFNPLKVGPDRRVYFIRELRVTEGALKGDIRLAGPSGAPAPDRPANPKEECIRLRIRGGGGEDMGVFSGWKSHDVTWEWVCTAS